MTKSPSPGGADTINRLPRHTTPRKQRVVKYFLLTLLKIVARVDVQGFENLPDGAFVAVINHLSSFDTLTGIAVGPIRQATTFAAIEHRSDPIGGLDSRSAGRDLGAARRSRSRRDQARAG